MSCNKHPSLKFFISLVINRRKIQKHYCFARKIWLWTGFTLLYILAFTGTSFNTSLFPSCFRSNYFIQPSFAVCDGLMPSRLSFLGMNPLIEKFMKGEAGSDVQTKEEADVSLEEMAETYASNSTLVETMANKFHKKKRDKSNDKEPDRKKMRLSDT